MKKLLLGLLSVTMLMSCQESSKGTTKSDANATESRTEEFIAEDISVDKAVSLIKEGNIVLLDVRTAGEFAEGHIEGATNFSITGTDFQEYCESLDKSKTYVVYCRSGGRSEKAKQMMNASEIKVVYNVLGGITSWERNGNKVVK